MGDTGKCPSCGQSLKVLQRDPKVRRIWPLCQAIANRHGKSWMKLSEAREKLMSARLAEYPDSPVDILWQAISGAVTYWSRVRGDFDITGNLVPETVYAKSNFTKYLEAYVPETVYETPAAAKPVRPRRPVDPELAALTPAEIAANRIKMAETLSRLTQKGR